MALGVTVAWRFFFSRPSMVVTVTVTVLSAVSLPSTADESVDRLGTYTGLGVTVVRRKLEQSADRDARGSKPGRVPVTARLQLLPAQFRSSRTAAAAKDNKDTKAASFMLAVVLTEMLLGEPVGDVGPILEKGVSF